MYLVLYASTVNSKMNRSSIDTAASDPDCPILCDKTQQLSEAKMLAHALREQNDVTWIKVVNTATQKTELEIKK